MIMRPILRLLAVLLSVSLVDAESLQFKGTEGKPGNGKHIVLLAGDEEYRSEESCPMLAKILSKHHGFDTTVLFSLDDEGNVDPNKQKNIPGTEAIKTADLVITGLRFRDLPDDQLQPLADYLNAGKPIFGFRTSTHAFQKRSQIVAFFGFNESFAGMEGLDDFRGELAGFVDHTLKQGYDYRKAPRLVLATPTATENLSQ